MSDAPETIWAKARITTGWDDCLAGKIKWLGATEYRRTDLPLTAAQIMADERVKSLVVALERAMTRTDPDHDIYAWRGAAKTALAKLKEHKS